MRNWKRLALAAALAAGTAGLAGWWLAGRQASQPLDAGDVLRQAREQAEWLLDFPAFIREIETATDPELVALRERLATAEADLERERAALEALGLSLEPEPSPDPPPPDAQNAAPLYAELRALLEAEPLASEVRTAIRRVAEGNWSPENLELAARGLADRPDLLALAESAAARPRYWVSLEDWSGLLASLDQAARLLTAAAVLHAREDRFPEALARTAQALAVARQFEESPLGESLASATEERALLAGAEILRLAGPGSASAEALRSLLAARPLPSLEARLEAALRWGRPHLAELRAGHPAQLGDAVLGGALAAGAIIQPAVGGGDLNARLAALADDRAAIRRRAEQAMEQPLPPEAATAWQRLLDAAEAEYLARSRRTLQGEGAAQGPEDGLFALLTMALPGPERLAGALRSRRAWREVVEGALGLFAYRQQAGAFPERLEEALRPLPGDPYSGESLRYRREEDGFVLYSVGLSADFDGVNLPGASRYLFPGFRYPDW